MDVPGSGAVVPPLTLTGRGTRGREFLGEAGGRCHSVSGLRARPRVLIVK